MKRLLFIVLLALAAGYVVWPQNPGTYIPGGSVLPGSAGVSIGNFQRQGTRLGLDLQGGTQLTLQADVSGVPLDQRESAIRGLLSVIERRVNAYGVAEPQVQARGTDRVIVQLPGVRDIEEAKRLIGQTAKLEFRECVSPLAATSRCGPTDEWRVATGTLNGEPREVTGAYLVPGRQQVTFTSQAGQPEVSFEFNGDGAQLFEQVTRRLVQRQLGIFLDNDLVSAPTVNSVISQQGVITGLSLAEARLLAIQLNAGALPLPVTIEEERTVDATLGADSVRASIMAGEIALVVVVLFMVLYYGLPGLAPAGALIVYSLITLALFKLVPITLTLAGIAGFILSVGMAVDANILIFERMKEELRAGKSLKAAVKAGEDRAWPSIRDSNTSTLITSAVLYLFGNLFGATFIVGFALVLALGVAVSLFSSLFVTRTFLELLLAQPWSWRFGLFGIPIDASQLSGALGGRPDRERARRRVPITTGAGASRGLGGLGG